MQAEVKHINASMCRNNLQLLLINFVCSCMELHYFLSFLINVTDVYYVHGYFTIYRESFSSSAVQLFFFFNLRNLPEEPWKKLINWQDGKERMMFLQADRLRVLSEKPPLRQGTCFYVLSEFFLS